MKRTSETSGTMLNDPTFESLESQKKKTKRKAMRKQLRRYSLKTSLKLEGNSHPTPRKSESPKQDKPNTKHPKTRINQINKNQAQRTNIKSSKGKTTNNTQKDSHRITADLSVETLQARREWHYILKVIKEKTLQPRLLYPTRISFQYKGEIKSFIDKQKLKEFSTTKPALQQMLKDLLQTGNTEKVYKLELKTTK